MLNAIIFDFDGVILESMDLKAEVFRELFRDSPEHQDRIVRLHMDNGGMSRFEKFSLIYRDVLRREWTAEEAERLDEEFRRLLADGMLTCPFVPGMPGFLERRSREVPLFVVSGAPEGELREVLTRRGLAGFFQGIAGAPRPKPELLGRILSDHGWSASEAVYIGDSRYDAQVAARSGIPFIGRVRAGHPNPFPAPPLATVSDLDDLERLWPSFLARFRPTLAG